MDGEKAIMRDQLQPRWLKTELASVIMISTVAELSATVMVVFLGVGLVVGSVLGWEYLDDLQQQADKINGQTFEPPPPSTMFDC
ncbi:hypothetical protein SDJN03_15266, partial [Cucurbita argyrosperma subsp. sororia]